MLLEGGDSHVRLEDAITAITETRHRAEHGDGCLPACGVYTAAGVDKLQAAKMAEAMKTEQEQHPELWRLDE